MTTNPLLSDAQLSEHDLKGILMPGAEAPKSERNRKMREDIVTPFEYAMFSPDGNLAVEGLVQDTIRAFRCGEPDSQIAAAYQRRRAEIAKTHLEVRDTAVREAIWNVLQNAGLPETLYQVL